MTPVPSLPDELVERDAAPSSAYAEIGRSREDRPILGYRAGRGPVGVSLIGGCHADEPVGPALLGRLAGYLDSLRADDPILEAFDWRVVPDVNPDGAERNRGWTGEPGPGYELRAYLSTAVRELPGDDIEFGFPSSTHEPDPTVRPENRSVARFLSQGAPIAVHGSFHGMGLSPGPWFLLEQAWVDRTGRLRARLTETVERMGYELFDVERRGEKGFHRIAPGFSTRPDSAAMRAHFEAQGDPDQAAKFRPSSMELARAIGRDALTFVTEMPLFLTPSLAGRTVSLPQLAEIRSQLTEALARPAPALEQAAAALNIRAMPIRDQVLLQLAFLNESLAARLRSEGSDAD